MCAEMRKSDDGFRLQKKGRKYLLWPFILLVGILIYTRNDPIDFMVRPSVSFTLVGLLAAAVFLFIPTSLTLWIQEWRKINHNPCLNAIRCLALMLFMSALFAFLILRVVTQLLLDHAPEHIMHVHIIGFYEAGRGGCASWILRLPNGDEANVCRTGPGFPLHFGQVLKVSVRQTAWAYEIRYLGHHDLPPQP